MSRTCTQQNCRRRRRSWSGIISATATTSLACVRPFFCCFCYCTYGRHQHQPLTQQTDSPYRVLRLSSLPYLLLTSLSLSCAFVQPIFRTTVVLRTAELIFQEKGAATKKKKPRHPNNSIPLSLSLHIQLNRQHFPGILRPRPKAPPRRRYSNQACMYRTYYI